MKQKLYHCQNVEMLADGVSVDKFVWGRDKRDATLKLHKVLDKDVVEWVPNNFVPREVLDTDGKPITRYK